MKINIFGVGCSGTKAVQLYLAYLIAKKEGVVKVNYEPYYWMSRKVKEENRIGINHHINSKLINIDGIISDDHSNFLSDLIPKNISSVTKFIRANGRIKSIKSSTNPDFTIVIIRNLYEVLNSMSKNSWDFLGKKLSHPYDWNRLIREVQEDEIISEEDLKEFLKTIKNELDKNAFYWYIMNLVALESNENVDFFMGYSNLCVIEKIAEHLNLKTENMKPITNEIFEGDNIYSDSLLIELDNQSPMLKGLQISSGTIDTCTNEYNHKKNNSSVRTITKLKMDLYNNDMYEYFHKDIESRLSNVKNKLLRDLK